MNVTPYDKGLEKGLQEGLEKGREKVLRECLRDLLEVYFPGLPASALERLEKVPASRLRELYKAALTVATLLELGLED